MAEPEPYFVGPMRCTVVIVPHKDFKLTLRKIGAKTDDWNPTQNHWGDEKDNKGYYDRSKVSKDRRIVKGDVQQDGKALIRANSSCPKGTVNDVHYTIRVPGLAKSFDVRLRFSLFNVDSKTKVTLDWEWDDSTARKYLNVFEGSDEQHDEGWSLKKEVRVEPSETTMTALANRSTVAPIITSLKATPSIPLYTLDDQKSRKCKFDSNGMEVWNNAQTSDIPSIPFAVTGTQEFLTIAIRNPWSGLSNKTLNVLGTFKARNGSTASVWDMATIGFSVNQDSSPTAFKPTIGGLSRPKHLPSGFDGNIEWTVTLSDDPDGLVPLQKFSIPLEFYCLPNKVPKIISDGLPAQLLRILLQTRYPKQEDSPWGWVKFCMDFLRSQNFRYETSSGRFNYVNREPTHPVSDACYLEHWLSHYDTLRYEHELTRQRRVNCFDLAALGHVLLAIGLDATNYGVRMKHLRPFGMINVTNLIGIGSCNNPFFEKGLTDQITDPDPIAKKDSKKYRTGFGSHVFLAVVSDDGEKIVDATCGPQVGDFTLSEYIEKAIDHDASQTLKYKNGDLISRDGDVGSVQDGPGVIRIISPVDVPPMSHHGSPTKGILSAVSAAAADKDNDFTSGKLVNTSIHTDGMVLSLSWLFLPAASDSCATIDILVYESKGSLLQLEYMNRKAAFDQPGIAYEDLKTSKNMADLSMPKTVNRGIINFEKTSQLPFALWQQGLQEDDEESLGMVVIVNGFGTSEIKGVVHGLMNVLSEELKDSAEKERPTISCAAGSKKEIEVVVGHNTVLSTECTVEGDNDEEVQIIGVNVDVDQGNIVYLEPKIDSDKRTFEFTFHARSVGSDQVTITYFTTHMHMVTIKRRFIVKKA